MKDNMHIKKRLNLLISMVDQTSNELSLLEKDILLQEIRNIYLEISDFQINVTPVVNQTISEEKPKVVEQIQEVAPKQEEKIGLVEKEVVEENKPELTKELIEEIVSEEVVENKEIKQNIAEEPKQAVGGKTLGETLGQDRTSLNEMLGDKSQASDISTLISQKPIDDIKSAIGIGDKFMFIRELFASDTDLFDKTILDLNQLHSFDDAKMYLAQSFSWSQNETIDTNTVDMFTNIVKRRYL